MPPPLRIPTQVFVASKFDNRLKEFAERWEVDKYLAATGYLPPKVRPFFVALPKVQVRARHACCFACAWVSMHVRAPVQLCRARTRACAITTTCWCCTRALPHPKPARGAVTLAAHPPGFPCSLLAM